MAYEYFKIPPRGTTSHKVLHDKAFNIIKNPRYNGYQRDLTSMVYKSFNEKTSGGSIKSEIMPKQQLTEELHKPINIKFEKPEICSSFKDNIRDADPADMKLISTYDK